MQYQTKQRLLVVFLYSYWVLGFNIVT